MPIKFRLDWANAKYAIRLNGLDVTHPVLQRLPDAAWHFGLWPYQPPPLPPHSPLARTHFPSTRLIDISKLTDPRGERLLPFLTPPWRRTELDKDIEKRIKIVGKDPLETKEKAAERHMKSIEEISSSPDHILVYSDGSQVTNTAGKLRTGAGIVAYKEHQTLWEKSIGLGEKAEVYDAEMEGMASAMEFIIKVAEDEEWGMGAHHIHLYADNIAAVQAIFKGVAAPGQNTSNRLRNAVLAHLDAHPENTVTIEWVPGHCDVPGNERSDEIAKTGTARNANYPSTLTHAKRKAKADVLFAWKRRWAATPPAGGSALADRFPPSFKPPQHFLNLPRRTYGLVTQCRTGHGFFGEYYRRFVPSEDAECWCGLVDVETREHILLECPFYDGHREILTEAVPDCTLAEILGTKDGIRALAEFIEKAPGVFRKG